MASTHALQKETHSDVIVAVPRRKCARDPIHTPVKSVIRVGASGLTEPLPVSRIVQAQLVSGFGCRHCIKQFLLDGRKPALSHRASRTRTIAAVDDADQTVCPMAVLAPHGSDLVLAFHVTLRETRILVHHCFNADAGDQDHGRHFAEFQLTPCRSYSSRIESNHPCPHLVLAYQALLYSHQSPAP